MKKHSLILLSIIIFGLTLTGCESNNKTHEESKALQVVKDLANLIGENENNIIESGIYWNLGGEGKLNGYSITNNNANITDIYNGKIDDYFDGWVLYPTGDGMREFYNEYLNDNLVCNVNGHTNADLEQIYSLMYNESDNEEKSGYDQASEIIQNSSFSIEINCAEFTNKIPSPLEFTFRATGEEPFWDADITPNNIKYNTAGGLNIDLYPEIMQKDGENLSLIARDTYNQDFSLIFNITKEECIDGGIGNSHEYSIKIQNSDAIFEGCADKRDNFLISQRQGKLSDFIKETGYKYEGKWNPESLRYSLRVEGDLINLYIFNSEENISEEDQYFFIILGNTDHGLETYWIGGYEIDDETCEKYHLVEGLMDFGPFSQCPRG